ncbi:uncharacterized protein LOC142345271 [Convolutriloba macropyga]|uniref:uncharacterized protein LOC142345271 n=1 Tax=Convolutriloba macropyga TaxID=536237 RepID=UPI003F51EE45
MVVRVACLRVMKRALRLAKNWNAIVATETEIERSHLRGLIDEEYSKSVNGFVQIDTEYLTFLNSRLDMIEHYKSPYERPTHYAQHATVLDFHSMKKQQQISAHAKLPNSKQNIILTPPKKIK